MIKCIGFGRVVEKIARKAAGKFMPEMRLEMQKQGCQLSIKQAPLNKPNTKPAKYAFFGDHLDPSSPKPFSTLPY